MARKESKLKFAMFAQQIDPEYWDWEPEEKQALATGAAGIGEVMQSRLEKLGMAPSDFYIIQHDKDVQQRVDLSTGETITDPKAVHVHGILRWDNKTQQDTTLSNIAAAIGVEPQYVEKPARGRYSYVNALAYMTHIKYPDKHQYSPEEVVTVCGKDYLEHYSENINSWKRGAAHVKKKKATGEDVDYYVQKVLMGELEINNLLLNDELYLMYHENKRAFDQAEATFGRRQAVKAAKALEEGQFHTKVFYVTGPPGSGKTHWVTTHFIPRIINAAAEQGQNWRVYTAAATNPMDDWHGHEIVLLDDVRASTMTATDWLRFLDPYQAANLSARYENKMSVAPRIIVINAYSYPHDFFRYVKAAGDEAMDQFIRRLSMIWEVVNYDPMSGNGVITAEEIGKTHPHHWVRDAGKPWEKKIPMNYGVVTKWQNLTTTEAEVLGLIAVAVSCSDIELMPQDITQQQQALAKGRKGKDAVESGKLGQQLALMPPPEDTNEHFVYDPDEGWIQVG